MPDFRELLRRCLVGRVCLVGVGNTALGDDGFGVRLSEALSGFDSRSPTDGWRQRAACPGVSLGSALVASPGFGRPNSDRGGIAVLTAGPAPEHLVGRLTEGEFDTVMFLDAVDFGASPGSVALLGADEVSARFPQVSTHKISLGLLARLVEAGGTSKVWLLGVQPESVRPSPGLTPRVQATLQIVWDLFAEVLACDRGMSARSRKTL
jgi:hydrogenase 3 maturation protease